MMQQLKPIMISIANIKTKLKIRCSKFKSNSPCEHKYSDTTMLVLLDMDSIRCLYVPSLKCIRHNQISKIIGWRNVAQQCHLGAGDILINKTKFWTLNKWKTNPTQQFWHFDKKIHFSSGLMTDFLHNIINNSLVMNKSEYI